jgi:hypothetical protein
MSFNLCGTCSELIPKRYDRNACKVITRRFGSDKIIGFHCSVDFTNILDTATAGEWDDYLTSGAIILSPFFGKFALGTPESGEIEDGLGKKYRDTTEVPWTFTTAGVSETYADEDWFYAFDKQFQYYSWGYFDVNGRLALNDKTVSLIKATPAGPVASNKPGFDFSLNSIPTFGELNGAGKAGQWVAEGSFITDSVIRTVAIPGLSTLLNNLG